MNNLILYGGTFDPIHNGHLSTAIEIQKSFQFDRFAFLPCKIPILKHKAEASAAQRVEMLKLALAKQEKHYHFAIDCSEVNRETPSYTVESLQSFRNQLGSKLALTLLMGVDVFKDLPHWYKWTKLLTLANLLVIKRAGIEESYSQSIQTLLKYHETQEKNQIKHQANGLIYRYDAGQFNLSSSWVRQQLAQDPTVLDRYLPHSVLQYIQQNRLYGIIE